MYDDITEITHVRVSDPRAVTRPVQLLEAEMERTEPQGRRMAPLLCRAFPAGLYTLERLIRLETIRGPSWACTSLEAGRVFSIRLRQIEGVFYPHLAPLEGGQEISGQDHPDLFMVLVRHLQRLDEVEALSAMLHRLGVGAGELATVLFEHGATWAQLMDLVRQAVDKQHEQRRRRRMRTAITRPQRPAA